MVTWGVILKGTNQRIDGGCDDCGNSDGCGCGGKRNGETVIND